MLYYVVASEMPITKIEWEAGISTDSFKMLVFNFLRNNPSYAFTMPEIMSSVGIHKANIKNFIFCNQVHDFLSEMDKEGVISAKVVRTVGGYEDIYFQFIAPHATPYSTASTQT